MDIKKFRDRTFPIYRDILEGRAEPPPLSELDSMIFEKGMPKILITNVIEYFAAHWRDTEEMLNNIPNAAPPFGMCWMEGLLPERGFDITAEGPTHVGASYVGIDIANPDTRQTDRQEPGLTEWERQLFEKVEYREDNLRWITHFVGALKPPERLGYPNSWAPVSHLVSLVNADGSLETSTISTFGMFTDDYAEEATKKLKNEMNIIRLFLIIPPVLAISFLHCKNVELVEQTHLFHKDSRESASRLKKKSKLAKVRYHMLTVDPVKKVLSGEGKIQDVGMQKALHICRGHFKDYREHGLFGKYKGIYWWDQSLRGSKERGVMIKDYKELAPKQ